MYYIVQSKNTKIKMHFTRNLLLHILEDQVENEMCVCVL